MFIIKPNLEDLPKLLTHPILPYKIMFIVLLMSLLLCFAMTKKPSCKVYMIDFACYKPPDSQKSSKELTAKLVTQHGHFSEEQIDFMKKTMERSGIGDSTYLAEVFFRRTYNPFMKDTKREVEMAMFGSVDTLLAKTGVRCEDIGILIVNCCIYNTAPSLSSIVVNRYKFRENIITYNLVGMGCSAGLIAIELAKQLLQVHHNSYAMIVSTESITENCYIGKDLSKFLINCMFRVGGAAILLSNHPSDHKISKYQLLHAIHTNTSSSDRSYNCIYRDEDNAGIVGVNVNKDLLISAITTIRPNLITARPSIISSLTSVVSRCSMSCRGR